MGQKALHSGRSIARPARKDDSLVHIRMSFNQFIGKRVHLLRTDGKAYLRDREKFQEQWARLAFLLWQA
jgi:hypothetical protein